MMLPRVNLLKVVSVNGGIKGFERDLEEESMILSQIKITFDSYLIDIHSLKRLSDIIPDDVLEQPKPDFQGLDDPRSKLIVIDPEGKMDDWERISKIPVWSERFALVTNNTPSSYLEELDKYSVGHILMGEDKFDMVAVLKELYENFDCGEILIDVPGDISGELVKEGYVDEINLIVYPCIVDDEKGHFLDLPNLSNKIAPIKLSLRKSWSGDDRHWGFRYGLLKWRPKPGTFGPDDVEKIMEILRSIGSLKDLRNHIAEIKDFVENTFILALSTVRELENKSVSYEEIMKEVGVLMERGDLLQGKVDVELKRIAQLPNIQTHMKIDMLLYETAEMYGRELEKRLKKMGVDLSNM